jgi:hypothetical protein
LRDCWVARLQGCVIVLLRVVAFHLTGLKVEEEEEEVEPQQQQQQQSDHKSLRKTPLSLGWANIRHIFNIRIMNIFDLLFEYSNIIRSNILCYKIL